MKINKQEKGFALISSYFVIVVLTMLGIAFMSGVVSDSWLFNRLEGSRRAFWLAQAGLERALGELNNGAGAWTGWAGSASAKTLQVDWPGFGSFSVTVVNPSSSNPRITSIGYFPNEAASGAVSREVDAIAGKERGVFTYAAFGKSGVSIGGTTSTDSYQSQAGNYNQNGNRHQNGDVGSNNDVSAGGTYFIGGDASTGPSGVFNDAGRVSGAISHENDVDLPMPTIPGALAGLPGSGNIKASTTLNPGDYKYNSIDLTGKAALTVIGPARIYLTGSLSLDLSGQAQIVVSSSSTGPVTFYIDGNMSVSGQGIANTTQVPSNLAIFGTGTGTTSQSFDIGGEGTLYGVVYAPNAAVRLHGMGNGEHVFGSIVGNTVSLNGAAAIHYDEALAALRPQLGKFIVQSWKDSPNPQKLVQ